MIRTRTLALAATLLSALPLAALASPEEDAVLAPINAIFNGMSHRDAAAIKAPAIPNATLNYFHDGKPAQLTIEAFADRISKPPATTPAPAIRETIHAPIIHIDNDLAVVWAPFDFTIDGKVDHCGTDLFNLMRIDNQWRVISITWNSRKDCPAQDH
ncbi:MAG TPA: nuclear transport factor 2 family protein [Acidobacteriaceae bacterium]|nr:nuclear transport factor 2 family protein [Acidobacteriaceae bacterium]